MTVAVLGASADPERYSNRAVRLLLEHDHEVVPIHPSGGEIEGLPVASDLESVGTPIDTLTVYLRPALSEPLAEAMVALAPRRVILNPGTESTTLADQLRANGIEVEEACTLVLLNTGKF